MTTACVLHTPLCDLLGIRYPSREEGDIDNGNTPCGQSAGLIHGVRGAAEVVEAMVAEAEAVLAKLAR
jgi:NAD(P)H-dependent flavin oxidoreductase YrpB (nitropropane dioxygenase family)